MAYDVRIFDYGSTDYKEALKLRTKILRVPLGLTFTTEELEKDEFDMHIGLFDGDTILACLTLTKCDNSRIKMRQVAVDGSFQGKGLGKKLSLAAEKYALENGFNTMFCHARKTAVPFYLKLGYEVKGPEFTEVTIPHFAMEKKLN